MSNQHTPSMQTSEEATTDQLDMARQQGETYVKALNHMANDVADIGGEMRAADYFVAYAIEKAEGMYHMHNGDLEWLGPGENNIHIEISVRDGADNRFIPNLQVYVTLIDSDGTEVGTHQLPYLWHPWLYHYGRNWRVERPGTYTLRVHIDAPVFPRHDPQNGKRFSEDVEIEFENVKIEI